MQDITAKDMQKMQMDSYSYYAETLLPSLLEWVDRDSLSSVDTEILQLMKEWDYFMDGDEIAPSFFRHWSGNFYRAVFYDEYETTEATLRYPSRDRFVEIIKAEPNFKFIDDIDTDKVETRSDIVTASFMKQ